MSGAAPAAREGAVLRGGLVLMLAKAVHTLASFGLYFALAPLLTWSLGEGGVAAFGVWGTTLLIANPLNMTFAQGTLQLVSRTVAAAASPEAAFAACLRRQLPVIIAGALLFQLAAPLIAEHYLNDPAYTLPLRIGGLIFPLYGLRALFQGWCNGVQDFRRQSWIDMGTSVLRMALVIGAVLAGWGALGALGAFVVASAVMLGVAWLWIRPPAPAGDGTHDDLAGLARFQWQVMAVTLVTFFLMSQDQVAVKAHAHADPAVTDRLAGYFTGCLKIAQIPWAVVSALVWVLFPLVAERSGCRDTSGQREVLRQGFRLVLLLLVPVAAGLAATAGPTYALVFPTHVRDAVGLHQDSLDVVSGPLGVMAWSYLVYGLLIVSSMLLTAEGRAGTSLLVMAVTLGLGHLATTHGVQQWGPWGAALGSGLAWVAGLVAAQAALVARHGAVLPLASVSRIGLAGALLYVVARWLPGEGLALLARDALGALVYLGAVLLLGEVTPAELRRVALVALRRPVA